MPADHTFPTDRTKLTRLLFPAGVPILWSPTLVFYDEAGRIDRGRQLAHLAFMTPHVKGYLVPGSTGDAWEIRKGAAAPSLPVAPIPSRCRASCQSSLCPCRLCRGSAAPNPASSIAGIRPRAAAGFVHDMNVAGAASCR